MIKFFETVYPNLAKGNNYIDALREGRYNSVADDIEEALLRIATG